MMIKDKYNLNEDVDKYQSLSHELIFTQMNAKKEIKLFGERSITAMFKQYKQLDDGPMPGKPVVAPFNTDVLNPLDRKKTLEAVNLIKEKCCGNIKGRTCANGSKQRNYLKPDESVYSPTFSTKARMATLVIDAMEQRDVAIFDVPRAFLQTELPENNILLMQIRDQFVDVMWEVKPEYIIYLRYDTGKKVLYIKILESINGCIESALLWYKLYSETLEGIEFVINSYDQCVENKMINGKQCTIVWYVDDNKLSHVDPNIVT